MTRIERRMLLCIALACVAASLNAAQDSGYTLAILVDGQTVPEYAARNRIYVEALKGKDFVIRVSNPTGGRIAVALSVDGRNVIDAQRTTARAAAKWVLGPWETIDVPGWQVSGATARNFFFTETSSSYAKWLGDVSNVGTIEAVFYRERRREPEWPRPTTRFKDSPSSEAPAPESQGGAPGRDLHETRQASPPSDKSTAKREGADEYAATGIGRATDHPVYWVAFEAEASPAARIAVRYEFREQLVRLGILPRPPRNLRDDLYARDRARGFEHRYAPDPYRR